MPVLRRAATWRKPERGEIAVHRDYWCAFCAAITFQRTDAKNTFVASGKRSGIFGAHQHILQATSVPASSAAHGLQNVGVATRNVTR